MGKKQQVLLDIFNICKEEDNFVFDNDLVKQCSEENEFANPFDVTKVDNSNILPKEILAEDYFYFI